MIRQITLKEAVERGYDIHSLLGVDKETKQLIKKAPVVQEVIEAVNVTSIATPVEEVNNTDFEAFVAWCEQEYNRTPSMEDYRQAIEYYGVSAIESIV